MHIFIISLVVKGTKMVDFVCDLADARDVVSKSPAVSKVFLWNFFHFGLTTLFDTLLLCDSLCDLFRCYVFVVTQINGRDKESLTTKPVLPIVEYITNSGANQMINRSVWSIQQYKNRVVVGWTLSTANPPSSDTSRDHDDEHTSNYKSCQIYYIHKSGAKDGVRSILTQEFILFSKRLFGSLVLLLLLLLLLLSLELLIFVWRT